MTGIQLWLSFLRVVDARKSVKSAMDVPDDYDTTHKEGV